MGYAPWYDFFPETSVRSLLFLLFILSACELEPDEPAQSLCDDLMAAGDCMNDDNLLQCQEALAECPDGLLIMESCPLQFGC